MTKPFSTYRFVLVFALIISLLGAACYAPFVKKVEKVVSKLEQKKTSTSDQKLNIAQHTLSTISFAVHADTKFIGNIFEDVYFGLPFEVVHKIHPVLFGISYLENIFHFAICAQAP